QASAGPALLGEHTAREARLPADRVVEHMLVDEAAATLLDTHQPGLGKRRHGAPQRVPIDAEACRQLGFRRQSVAWRQGAVGDLLSQDRLDLTPQGHSRLALHLTSLAARRDPVVIENSSRRPGMVTR